MPKLSPIAALVATKASSASAQDQPTTTQNTAAATTSSSTNTPRAAANTLSGRPARVGGVISQVCAEHPPGVPGRFPDLTGEAPGSVPIFHSSGRVLLKPR